MTSIPIRLNDEIIKKIDILISKGRYKNRTEALRDQIIKGLDKISLVEDSVIENENFDLILKKMLLQKSTPDLLRTKKSVVDLVAEGRER